MAIHLVACTSYSVSVLNAEELVENIGMQQLLEEEVLKKGNLKTLSSSHTNFFDQYFDKYFSSKTIEHKLSS